jgi:hypothetical protein
LAVDTTVSTPSTTAWALPSIASPTSATALAMPFFSES